MGPDENMKRMYVKNYAGNRIYAMGYAKGFCVFWFWDMFVLQERRKAEVLISELWSIRPVRAIGAISTLELMSYEHHDTYGCHGSHGWVSMRI